MVKKLKKMIKKLKFSKLLYSKLNSSDIKVQLKINLALCLVPYFIICIHTYYFHIFQLETGIFSNIILKILFVMHMPYNLYLQLDLIRSGLPENIDHSDKAVPSDWWGEWGHKGCLLWAWLFWKFITGLTIAFFAIILPTSSLTVLSPVFFLDSVLYRSLVRFFSK